MRTLLVNGSIRCWGYNNEGQLGVGNTNVIGDDEDPSSGASVDLGPGRTAVAVSAGGSHTCAILDNGDLRCWGLNDNGQLGLGDTNYLGDDEAVSSAPSISLGAGRTAVAVSTGQDTTCAILDDATTRCWGGGGQGRLGTGNTATIGDDELPSTIPVLDFGASANATALSNAGSYACALLDNGSTRCWGDNAFGKLGLARDTNVGDNEHPTSAPYVNLGAGRTAVQVEDCRNNTCAIRDDGSVRCWGLGTEGRLGTGNTNFIGDNEDPGDVAPVDIGAGRTAVNISSEFGHTCVILDTGDVRCWGRNGSGQLGLGHMNNIGDDEAPSTEPTVDLGVGRTATEIEVGRDHTCAILDTGDVRCWGSGAHGRTGLNSTASIGDNEAITSVPVVSLGVGRTATRLSAGNEHTCALLDDGNVRCWGKNDFGQVGHGTGALVNIGDNELPTAIGTVDLGVGRTALDIRSGYWHTCALLDNGSVRCWGRSSWGQLGLGDTNSIGDNEVPSSVPAVSIGAGRTAIGVAAGAGRGCALLDDNSMRCWGYNGEGQLGLMHTLNIGDNELPSSQPALTLGSEVPTQIAATGDSACVLILGGNIRCWGSNASGHLGLGYTQVLGDNEPIASAPTTELGVLPEPINTSAGALGGSVDPSVDDELTCTSGTWWYTNTLSYLWRRDGIEVTGANANTYPISFDDDGASITCESIGTNGDGASARVAAGSRTVNTPPHGLTPSSPTHNLVGWNNSPDLGALLIGATDAHGIAGYSILVSANAIDEPGTTITTTANADTMTAPDGTVYLHARARDSTGRWGTVASSGPYLVDATAPALATLEPVDPSPQEGEWTQGMSVAVDVTSAADATSGIAGFSWTTGDSESTTPDEVIDLPETADSIAVDDLTDGTHYISVRAVDAAGNWSSPRTAGPFLIDNTAPVASVSQSEVDGGMQIVSVSATDAASGLHADGAYAMDDGQWQVSSTFAVMTGAETTAHTARIRDRAGNITSLPITIDSTNTESISLIPNSGLTPDVTAPKIVANANGKFLGKGARGIYTFAVTDDSGTISSIAATHTRAGRSMYLPIAGNGINTSSAPEGRGELALIATDTSGNSSVLRADVTIDRTAPAISVQARTTIDDEIAFRIRDSLSGSRRSVVKKRLPKLGLNNIKIKVRDRAGNTASRTLTVRRALSLANPSLNKTAVRDLGFAAGANEIDQAFKFRHAFFPWYKPPPHTRGIVSEAQRRLTAAGFVTPVTGRLDIATIISTKRFQRSRGISPIATIGPQTRKALDSSLDE